MYLFSRRTRLSGGHGTAGVEWATAIAAKVTDVTGHEVQLWANVYSPGYGTITWTAWFENLTALEAMGDQLAAEASYLELADRGAAYTEGGADDAVMQPLAGAPDPERPVQYVSGATAIIAGGSFERAIGVSMEMLQHGEKVTGIPGMFLRSLTGPYGSVGWLTGFESLAELERTNDQLAADPDMLRLIDGSNGCFLEAPGSAQTTLYRKLA